MSSQVHRTPRAPEMLKSKSKFLGKIEPQSYRALCSTSVSRLKVADLPSIARVSPVCGARCLLGEVCFRRPAEDARRKLGHRPRDAAGRHVERGQVLRFGAVNVQNISC